MTFLHEGKLNNQQLCYSNYFEPLLSIKRQQFPVNQRASHNQGICGFLVVFDNVKWWLWNQNGDENSWQISSSIESGNKILNNIEFETWNKQVKLCVNWTNLIELKDLKKDF